jgi:hypothetical protein
MIRNKYIGPMSLKRNGDTPSTPMMMKMQNEVTPSTPMMKRKKPKINQINSSI